jgi:hypothetical protein
MRHLPGFVSGKFHASTDETRVVNCVRWEALETLEAAQVHPAARSHMDRAIATTAAIEPATHGMMAR